MNKGNILICHWNIDVFSPKISTLQWMIFHFHLFLSLNILTNYFQFLFLFPRFPFSSSKTVHKILSQNYANETHKAWVDGIGNKLWRVDSFPTKEHLCYGISPGHVPTSCMIITRCKLEGILAGVCPSRQVAVSAKLIDGTIKNTQVTKTCNP